MSISVGTFKTISEGEFFDRHPILVPASAFSLFWIPYVIIFFRKSIAFGSLGEPYPIDSGMYWILLAIQLLVCVISHSLTIRTIVRLYAPRWLIWGSVAFYALSPAWGSMVAADIRHPMFAAVFCVFVSSSVFALYSRKPPTWLWIQLAGGALCVSLLRSDGIWAVIPTLALIFAFKGFQWLSTRHSQPAWQRLEKRFLALRYMHGSKAKAEESLWSDVCAAFLVLSAVSMLWLFTWMSGWELPLGEPSFGSIGTNSALQQDLHSPSFPFANLTGTMDMAGILPFADVSGNSVFATLADSAANAIYWVQCLPIENLTFSWTTYLVLFAAFVGFALRILRRDVRPIIIGLPMIVVIAFMAFVPADQTLRYIMPILAAQPMFFGACFASTR